MLEDGKTHQNDISEEAPGNHLGQLALLCGRFPHHNWAALDIFHHQQQLAASRVICTGATPDLSKIEE